MKTFSNLLSALFFIVSCANAQDIDQAAKDYLKKLHKPKSISEFKTAFHFPPVNQDTTNACWSFATNSFIETEMQRLGMEPVKLSVMFPFYYIYLEKAGNFVKTRGSARFAPGDLFSGVTDMVRKYGTVPDSVYSGKACACKTYNHSALEDELEELMDKIESLELWDESLAVEKARTILDKHLGTPPKSFQYRGKEYTPKSFSDQFVALPWDDYIIVTSFLYDPFYRFIELKVPDNWAHQKNYFNVPLDLFYSAFKEAAKKDYSLAFDSDTGEPGRMGSEDAVFVPLFDIPGKYINQQSREFRFDNGSTTDDHLMQIIGYKRVRGNDWFLVKDSWRTAWDGQHPGYYFFHGDYIRLKALAFMVHKDAVPSVTKHINQQ